MFSLFQGIDIWFFCTLVFKFGPFGHNVFMSCYEKERLSILRREGGGGSWVEMISKGGSENSFFERDLSQKGWVGFQREVETSKETKHDHAVNCSKTVVT